MIINSNIPALKTLNRLEKNNKFKESSFENLSSGLRITKAADDAAGLAISEKMRGQIRGLNMAAKNAQDSISLIQTAEGALNEVHDVLNRMRELSVQAANGTLTDSDRDNLEKEYKQLKEEISSIANKTEFNQIKLLDGSMDATPQSSINVSPGGHGTTVSDGWVATGVSGAMVKLNPDQQVTKPGLYSLSATMEDGEVVSLNVSTYPEGLIVVFNHPGTTFEFNGATFDVSGVTTGGWGTQHQGVVEFFVGNNNGPINNDLNFQIGANSGQTMSLFIPNMAPEGLAIDNSTIASQFSASSAIFTVDEAISMVSSVRSNLGAIQNRLEHTISNIDNASENIQSAESRIRDVDMAREMMEMTRANIISQASQSMLAQANQQPSSILQLLG
ncbi:flagellin [Halalkalibacter alkaliphilus]|nr:flagellin [Halalkalibacter alkaliphilus]